MEEIAKHVLRKVDGSQVEFESEAALMEYLASNKNPFEVEETVLEPEPEIILPANMLGSLEEPLDTAN